MLQAGIKASFSRPPSRAATKQDARKEERIGSCEPHSAQQRVLITEIAYESAGEETDNYDKQQQNIEETVGIAQLKHTLILAI